jgi:putative addiction module component (TIGR02574 family)
MSINEIQSAALKLELKERAKLAHVLLQSLDELSEKENERLWAEEAMRRYEELESGKSEEIPAEEVMRDAYARLNRK